jgi:NAD(P)-dependent dehydrogenase (short-subunit alcohol dehydrogenase family)
MTANGVGSVEGKVCVVTGAASGIGRATALRLAARGAMVALGDNDEIGLRAVGQEIRARGARGVREVAVDVTRAEAVERFRETTEAELGVADVIVNAAGVVVVGGLLATSPDDWDFVLGANLRGPAIVCRAFLPAMLARGERGQIVNVASAASFFTPGDLVAYGASKHALVGLSQGLREELAPHSIGVSIVCPGFVDTPIVRNARFASVADEDARRQHIAALLRRRGLRPERVAAAIVRAAERGSGVVPVGVEAWTLHALERLSPGASERLVRAVRSMVNKVGRGPTDKRDSGPSDQGDR